MMSAIVQSYENKEYEHQDVPLSSNAFPLPRADMYNKDIELSNISFKDKIRFRHGVSFN